MSPTGSADIGPLPSKPALTTPPEPNPTTIQSTTASKPVATAAVPEGIPTTPDLALLTCTFRPSDILRLVESKPTLAGHTRPEGWEFVPAKVPDGISLRNFGIQV
ncbi:hypothetical protein C0991_011683 [Blastosporella zonata]|nr:hypothetical protein C0991_011683 [Blastosporella zonata]